MGGLAKGKANKRVTPFVHKDIKFPNRGRNLLPYKEKGKHSSAILFSRETFCRPQYKGRKYCRVAFNSQSPFYVAPHGLLTMLSTQYPKAHAHLGAIINTSKLTTYCVKQNKYTMKVSVAASAARIPPETGASNKTGFSHRPAQLFLML